MDPFLGALQNSDLSAVLSSCEPELQELMKQIDIMVSNQRADWQAEVKSLQLRLKAEGEELQASRSLAARHEQEIRSLRWQLDRQPGQSGRQELVRKYEHQLQKVREELEKLKRSYQKLQRKQLKDRSSTTSVTEAESSEVTILQKKIEEYQRLCVQWEQQRIQQQKQVAELEVESKRLHEELTLSSAQQELFKQEQQEHRASYLEVQRLRTQLEVAQGRIHSQDLEVERLHALESQLEQKQREQQASVDSQDSSVRRASLERQRLMSEASRLNQVLQAKDHVIRCLEGCLAAQGCSGVELLRQDLEETSTRLHRAQSCEAELRAELACVSERLSQQRSEQPNLEELRVLRAQYDSSVAEARKLREELLRARQTHGGELEGMRKEVSRLTGELHSRDLAIASLQAERVEQNTGVPKTPQCTVQWRESPSSQTGATSLPGRDCHVTTADSQEQQEQQLRRIPVQLHPQNSALTRPEKYEGALLSHATTERQHLPNRDHQQGEQSGTRSEAEIQRLFQQLHTSTPPPPPLASDDTKPRSPAASSTSYSSSSSSSFTTPAANSGAKSIRRHLLETPAEGQSSSSDETLTAKKPTSAAAEVPLSLSPAEHMVSRFLEEENVRSSQLLQRLDDHIQGMIHDNVMTLTRFLPVSADLQPDQDPSPSQDPS